MMRYFGLANTDATIWQSVFTKRELQHMLATGAGAIRVDIDDNDDVAQWCQLAAGSCSTPRGNW